jgi:hypothetical protein
MGGVGLAEARGMTLRHRHCLNAAVRSIYRHAVVEPVLIALFGVQIALGLALVWRRGRPSGAWALAQVASGVWLALFVVQHVPAVLRARPETGTAFAAAVVQEWPGAAYFIPYYIAAVAALATHIAAAHRFAHWPAPPDLLARALPWAGAALGVVIVAGLLGAFG